MNELYETRCSYHDKDNNFWNKFAWSGEIQDMANSLTDCKHCKECRDCTRCNGCINCSGCVDCFECTDLKNCTNCSRALLKENVSNYNGLYFPLERDKKTPERIEYENNYFTGIEHY